MDSNQKNSNSPNDMNYEDNRQNKDEVRRNNNTIIGVIIGSIILAGLILYFVLTGGDSNYDRGMQYLRQKQYTEALVEFQKVEPDDKDFRMAQSKINYIMGLRAFNDGLREEAKVYLTKVEASDEYYNEAKLMIDKINNLTRQAELESLNQSLRNNKDTVIIREKVVETPDSNISEAQTQSKSRVNDNSAGVSSIAMYVKSIEQTYQLAKPSGINAKKKFISDIDSIYTQFKLIKTPNDQGNKLAELKLLVDSYVQKRKAYLQNLIAENSSTETAAAKTLREEGDQIYNRIISQSN